MTSDNILICGGAGYVGSALTSQILRETDFKVTVFDQLLYGGDSLYPFFNYVDRFKFIQGDLRTYDLDKLLNNMDYVVNLVGLVGEPICKKFPKKIQVTLKSAQKKTNKNKKLELILALNYGSKNELVNAIKLIISNKMKINESSVDKNLYTKGRRKICTSTQKFSRCKSNGTPRSQWR